MKGLKNKKLFIEKCYINGKWIGATGKSITVINPFDLKKLGTVPQFGQKETQQAIKAAHDAWEPWAAFSAKQRSDIFWQWAHLIDANKEDLAIIMTLEQGKPLTESRSEIDYANGFVKWFAEECRRVYGDIIPSNKNNQHLLVIKQPIGVVAAITPWNFPSAMITRKIAPALAAGCTVVVKPAEETPFSALALTVLAEQAGFPKGVINMVTGDAEAIGKEMTSNALVRKLSFTGSTAVGRLLMQQCASSIKKISLELGGNAPFIVFDDADLDAAVQGTIASKFRNTGQTCVCANRIFVQEKIYDKFSDKLVASVKKLKIGNGLEKNVTQGPLINDQALKKVKAHVKDAVDKGGKIIYGGKQPELGGLFFTPTVITRANSKMLLAKEETFGPVAALFQFKNEDDVIRMANDTIFGLASYFYSNDINRIWRVSEGLEYGMVGVNTGIVSTEVAPFGGVKQSGIGREGSKYGIDDYVEIKYVCMGTGE
jgi:succinate-semialdehyde dehydrogenase / glutarate-semialdehyde dehydrogenase